ncbi:hypothetical protein PaG_06013 [Moesziomyces aphidis]|uniref:BTB domain-containing protein n=1 Tax=Moesziomyces aphidis TaxID=84754 RepID=W3VGT7_MOEAP|nr:hypothetical protein PaG_06013 [Moesziomyces aphidis]
MTSAPLASADRRLPRARTSQAPSASGPTAFPGAVRPSSDANRASTSSSSAAAGPSRMATVPAFHRPRHDDPVRAAQEEATRVWRADLRRLLERAEDRFADICWTTAPAATHPDHSDLDSDVGHSLNHAADAPAAWSQAAPPISQPSTSLGPAVRPAPTGTLIWAHKAILYARAPNTFQTRFLNLRSPAAQLQHIGSTASLVSLPLHRSTSQLSLASHMSNSTQTAFTPSNPAPQASKTSTSVSRAGMPPKPRKSIRGAAPPSSFSMTKPSLRKPISRSSISRPLRRAAGDDAASIASGFATSDSEGEGALPSSLRSSRFINTRPTSTPVASASLTSPSKLSQASSAAPARKSSFASVTSAADSHLTADNASVVSDASTLRAPISLGGVSHAFFDATLQYLYTGEEAMVDAFEFLFEDRLAPDSQAAPEEKLDKLRSDLTYMWRSKLYSDVKIVLGDDDDARNADDASMAGDKRRRASRLADIPDANMSVLSLAQTVDTDRIDESDDDDELTLFSTHRMILASRSEYFASMLLSSYADAGSQVLRLPSPPFTPASLHFTLGFLYTGTLFFSNRTFDLATAFSLWRAGAYLQIATLQALVTALIDREFCHAFACAPPCRKCLKRVPRALAFAANTPPKPMAPPSRLVARPGAVRQASPAASAAVSARSPASTRSLLSTPRATAPVATSRLRTASTSSTASSASAASPTAQRRLPREDGEREAGPIHMRAAVLNRNAARTSVANGHRALSAASASPPASVTKTDAKPSSGSSPRTPGAAPSTVAVRPRTTPVRSAPQTSTPAVSANGRVRTHSSSSTVSTTSAASVRATSRTKLTPPGPSVRPASVAGVRSAATLVGDANKTPTKSVRPVRSSTSLSARPARAGVSVDSAPTKKPSVPSLAAKSFLRATPGPGGTFSLSSTDSGRELRARTLSAASHKTPPEVQSNSNLPAAEARLERSDSSTTIVVHPTNGPSERGAETAAPGMRLEMGIACIVSLDCDGAAHKVRALVRYLGRIPDHTGVWVGVELRLPPTGCHAIRLTDGCLDGVRYFQPHRVGPTEDEARRERRRQLWHQVCPHTAFPDPDPAADTRDEQDQVLLPAQSVVWVIQ